MHRNSLSHRHLASNGLPSRTPKVFGGRAPCTPVHDPLAVQAILAHLGLALSPPGRPAPPAHARRPGSLRADGTCGPSTARH